MARRRSPPVRSKLIFSLTYEWCYYLAFFPACISLNAFTAVQRWKCQTCLLVTFPFLSFCCPYHPLISSSPFLSQPLSSFLSFSVDPFLRKEWYDIRAPTYFKRRQIGRAVTTKTTGQKTARDNLVGRVITQSLGDLNEKGDDYRKFSLKIDEVQGTQCLTSFHGMSLTTDKQRAMVRKHHSLVECANDVKTTDGYTLRVFTIGLTRRAKNQARITSYAKRGQRSGIRKVMTRVVNKEVSRSDVPSLIKKLSAETMGRTIEKQCQGIYPLQNVFVRKVKVIRAPKVDVARLLDLHGGADAIKRANEVASVVAAPVVERPEEEATAEA